MYSEFKRPIEKSWQTDSLIMSNLFDVLEEIKFLSRNVVIDTKIIDKEMLNTNEKSIPKIDSKRKMNSSEVGMAKKIKKSYH